MTGTSLTRLHPPSAMTTPENSADTYQSNLVSALATIAQDDTVANRSAVLAALATSAVTVILDQPWDGASLPELDTRFLLVSDGNNTEQPMLAIFSTRDCAQRFRHDVDLGNEFEHLVEVSGSWSLLGVTEGVGVMIDPNQSTAFRITPELAAELRNDVREAMDRVLARQDGANGSPDAEGG